MKPRADFDDDCPLVAPDDLELLSGRRDHPSTTLLRDHAVLDCPGRIMRMSERLQAVVDQLGLRPDDRVLEIGSGHGVAATLVCERLEEGRLTAIDRSAKMIAAAERRNAAHVEAGKAEFLVSALEDLDLGDRRFELIFAVRVGLFHREPVRSRRLAEKWLAPGGRLLVFWDEP